MTTPKEALELKPCPFCGGADVEAVDSLDFVSCQNCGASLEDSEPSARELWNTRATTSLQGEDAVERVARAICQSGKFETGQGTCALICMDQLGDVRKKGCSHCIRVHGAMARAILATGLVPNKS